jgi:hypothetical protein
LDGGRVLIPEHWIGKRPKPKKSVEPKSKTPARPQSPQLVKALSDLAELWRSGALTDKEFEDAKAKILKQLG